MAPDTRDAEERWAVPRLVAIFVILAVGIASAGYVYYRNYEKHYRSQVERELASIAQLKVAEIAEWRRERLRDASVLSGNPSFSDLVAHFLGNPGDANARDRLRARLTREQVAHQYARVSLLDANGVEYASVPDEQVPGTYVPKEEVAKAVRSRQMRFVDFYWSEHYQRLYLQVLVPVLASAESGTVLGVVAIYPDPELYLYPLIKRWPTDSETAETLLVRREGNEVVFLNNPRFKDNTALTQRFSLDKKDLPAVMAVLGQQGIVEGVDYRGHPVLADILLVPDSPWFMVAKIDRSEVYAPLREELWQLIVLVSALILGTGAFVGLAWRQQRARFYRNKYETAEALRALSARHEAILAAVPDIVMEVDSNTIYTWANGAGFDFFGEDVVGKEAAAYFVGEQNIYGTVQPLFNGDDNVTYVESWQRRKDGESRLLAWWCRSLKDANGNVTGILSTARDVTERRRAEERIEHLSRVLRAVRNVNQLIVQETDPERLIQKSCDLLVEQRGYTSALIILTSRTGQPPLSARAGFGESRHSPVDRFGTGVLPRCCDDARVHEGAHLVSDEAETCAACALVADHAATERMCIRLKHGDIVYGYLVVSAVHELGIDDEERSLFAEVSGDIAFALHNIEMSHAMRQAEERREKAEAELRQAQKMEDVGRLAGGVAHDFNNMLSVILGYTEMALDALDAQDELHEAFSEIKRAAERSADLVRQLLAFSRKQTAQPAVINLNDRVANQKKMLDRLIGEDIEFTFVPGAGLWNVRIDPSQAEQILANLVVNARDAIAGVGAVTLETVNVTLDESHSRGDLAVAGGDYVMLAVSDTGAGMDASILEHIFEPFFTTKKKGEGTGLGLSTVYGIVRQNDGVIHVYSEPGMGTTFKIYLPRFIGEDREPARETRVSSLSGAETILIVEDESMVLQVARKTLDRHGYQVLAAGSAQEAWVIAETHQGDIHLLVTDVVLPGMNGKDLQARIERIKPGVKTLFMSGYTADVIAHRGILDEGIHFIHKPFAIDSLAAKVRQVLDS